MNENKIKNTIKTIQIANSIKLFSLTKVKYPFHSDSIPKVKYPFHSDSMHVMFGGLQNIVEEQVLSLILLHFQQPKLHRVLAILSAIRLTDSDSD